MKRFDALNDEFLDAISSGYIVEFFIKHAIDFSVPEDNEHFCKIRGALHNLVLNEIEDPNLIIEDTDAIKKQLVDFSVFVDKADKAGMEICTIPVNIIFAISEAYDLWFSGAIQGADIRLKTLLRLTPTYGQHNEAL